jgi:hypothetical protein
MRANGAARLHAGTTRDRGAKSRDHSRSGYTKGDFMTQKHFIMLAAMLARTKPVNPTDDVGLAKLDQWKAMAQALTVLLACENPRFKRAVFEKAAGMES